MKKENKDFLFDIDGTLTPPLKCMTQSHTHFFLSWSIDKNFYLVGGSDIQKIKKQLPHSILRRSKGIFSSMANVLEDWTGRVVYKNDWKCSTNLLNELQVILNESPYPKKKTHHIEKRIGMLNFSVAGRDSTERERKEYFKWDSTNNERLKIISKLSKKFKNLDFRLGGMISIDIQPKGFNKAQACEWVRKNNKNKIIYFGDKIFKDGNDYDAYLNLKKYKDGECHLVDGPENTCKILQEKY